MKVCVPDENALRRFIAELETSPPKPHHSGLLAGAARLSPDCTFRFALTRGHWHRPGGVIRPDGERIADALESWVEGELAACDGDFAECLDRHDGDDLLVTRHAGRSLYFVAPYGPGPADFMQLEVEELQEMLDRRLIDPDNPPSDPSDLTEPLAPLTVDPQPVGQPYYRFRRLLDMRRILSEQSRPGTPSSPLGRFMDEWRSSRAAGRGHFSDHWVVAVRTRHDRYGNEVTDATPVSLHARKLKTFQWQTGERGTGLGDQIHAFDRVGYPAAWYFHLVAGGLVPRELAYALMDDWIDGFRYLSDHDAALLKGWIEQPYSV